MDPREEMINAVYATAAPKTHSTTNSAAAATKDGISIVEVVAEDVTVAHALGLFPSNDVLPRMVLVSVLNLLVNGVDDGGHVCVDATTFQ